jgi:hypothetical protein
MNRSYSPYHSSTESDTDTDTENDSTDSEDPRIRREQDPRYSILRAPTETISDKTFELKPSPGAPWNEKDKITSYKNYTYLHPPKTTRTTLVSIRSSDRDITVFPSPYRFQLKLPRVYKNITKFQMVQMSFPNNANNITAANLYISSFINQLMIKQVPYECLSTCLNIVNGTSIATGIGVVEQGRINEVGNPLMLTFSLPDGSYNNNQLANELTQQANNTPPFNLISYNDFKEYFQITRDASYLFNEPGDCFFSKTNNIRYGSHNKDHIMNTYYSQTHIDRVSDITDSIALTTYYFPILKEFVATGYAEYVLQYPMSPTFSEVQQRVMGPFEGLDSPYYYEICSTNIDTLDNFRRNLTFELQNINQYKWIFNDKTQQFTTIHDTLHTSLQRELSKQYQYLLQQELSVSGFNASSFKTLKTHATSYSSIYKHLERNLSTTLGNYFLVPSYVYSGGDFHSTFSTMELHQDSDFTGLFQYQSTFGRIHGSYSGLQFEFRNFLDYHSTLSSYYHISQSTQDAINQIHQRSQYQFHTYISEKYKDVFPSSMIANQSYQSNQALPVCFVTDQYSYLPGQSAFSNFNSIQNQPAVMGYRVTNTVPCIDICSYVLQNMVSSWYSNLPVNSVIHSIPYRLGLTNILPEKFNIFSTVGSYTSTGNLNYLMQINENQGFSNIDVTMPENYNTSNETTGQVKFMYCKILMGDLGDTGVSQTVIQNPVIFENTLGKLDKLDFKIYYDDTMLTPAWLYMPFILNISEWNATFQIDEEVYFPNPDMGWSHIPTIPIPENPNDTQYLWFHKKETENK